MKVEETDLDLHLYMTTHNKESEMQSSIVPTYKNQRWIVISALLLLFVALIAPQNVLANGQSDDANGLFPAFLAEHPEATRYVLIPLKGPLTTPPERWVSPDGEYTLSSVASLAEHPEAARYVLIPHKGPLTTPPERWVSPDGEYTLSSVASLAEHPEAARYVLVPHKEPLTTPPERWVSRYAD